MTLERDIYLITKFLKNKTAILSALNYPIFMKKYINTHTHMCVCVCVDWFNTYRKHWKATKQT